MDVGWERDLERRKPTTCTVWDGAEGLDMLGWR